MELTSSYLQGGTVFFSSLLFSSLVTIIIIVWIFFLSHVKRVLKRLFQIRLCERIIHSNSGESNTNTFLSYYQNILCHLQKVNNEFLSKILQKNQSCAFFVNRSISLLSSSLEQEYALIDEFREKVPLTAYDDYCDYVNRTIENGDKNLLCSDDIIYFAMTSGTTGKNKRLPVTASTLEQTMNQAHRGSSVIWESLRTSAPSKQRSFNLRSGKHSKTFPRSKDGVPIGQISQIFSAVAFASENQALVYSSDVLALDLIAGINDFETNTFVQLVFALAIPNIVSYSVVFAPGFIHTVKIIEKYFEEIYLCISSTNFDHSSFVRDHIRDLEFRAKLNQVLGEIIIEYGGSAYQLKRAEAIRKECCKKGIPGILHRLWPTLMFASTAIGSSFAIYKEEIRFYCGEKLPLINCTRYSSCEGTFGFLASIHTDEYFLSPTSAFFEFIKEEDVNQVQPKTLLISEIEPGNRYELVCTTEAGLVRYRMGDVINCTRFLCRTNDLVPLPSVPTEIPRIPLISIAYRLGSLLDVFGEKTTEQHISDALKQSIDQWRTQGIFVDLCDFTTCPKLDVFPPRYIIFLELIDDQGRQVNSQQLQTLQAIIDTEVERQICRANNLYQYIRNAGKFGPLVCILVRSETFSTFRHKILMNDRLTPLQIKPHRLLKNEHHIQFFYDNQIDK